MDLYMQYLCYAVDFMCKLYFKW